MDGAASISQLIQQVLNLISKVLVLSLDNIKLFNNFIVSSLQSE